MFLQGGSVSMKQYSYNFCKWCETIRHRKGNDSFHQRCKGNNCDCKCREISPKRITMYEVRKYCNYCGWKTLVYPPDFNRCSCCGGYY